MTKKTIKNQNEFHINLSDSGAYSDAYKSFLAYEPKDPTHTLASDVSLPQLTSQGLGLSEIPEIQESTHQVPCGQHSIFDPDQKVPAFVKAVYLKVNEHSNWDNGISHALSLRRLAKLLNVKSHSQVHRALKWLIENGWLKVENKRKSDGAYFYKITHHNCEPHETPVDKNGRPQKCAVPTGAGSPSELLADGKTTWHVFIDWTVRKIHSCWTSGVVSMTVREAAKLMKFSTKTIAENAKKMVDIGLLERLSKKFRLSEYQMFPKPYPERRDRKPEGDIGKKPMKLIKGWYYSYNGLWRFERETFRLQMRDNGRWIESTYENLRYINKNIYRDFMDYIDHLKIILKFNAHIQIY